MKHIYFTVTNDLTYDQRMHRICSSLAAAGFKVTLVGRQLNTSIPLQNKSFLQKRLKCFFNKGFLFYSEYNMRLFFFLLSKPMDAICAIDLDTILPCLFISKFKKIPRVYDAHEYFTEMKEVGRRKYVQKFWMSIEKFSVPRFEFNYTVSESLAQVYNKKYNRNFATIRNLPVLKPLYKELQKEKYLLAQGAVNEGRAFEWLIPAMRELDYKLVVCGDGNFMSRLKDLIIQYKVEDKVELKGMMLPDELWPITQKARLGLGLAEKEGIHQYLALPNKFFDYIHAGLPQLAMAYPEYEKINNQFQVSVLIDDLSVDKIVGSIKSIMEDDDLLNQLHLNCLEARKIYCWQAEEKLLIDFYNKIFRIDG